MIVYTVLPNDTLSEIAYRYQTTVSIIMGDNEHIKDKNFIIAGSKINIRTSEEFAKDKAASAKASTSKANNTLATSSPQSTGVVSNKTVTWEGLEVKPGQSGLVTVTKRTTLYALNSDGTLKVSRTLNVNERYRSYGEITEHGGMYMLGGSYVKKSDVSFEALPVDYKIFSSNPGDVTVTFDGDNQIEKKQSSSKVTDFSIPQFEMPGYRRLRMQVKKVDGKTLSMELRAQSFNVGYSNTINPTRTNQGWMVNIGGKNLSSIQISGFLLDTKANPEADDFLTRYEEHLSPKNSDKYFASALTTLLYKDREYKGLINALSVADQADMPLDRKFSMQFLVLSEKSLNGKGITGTQGTIINRNGLGELEFLSDIKNMLANPITGKYNTDV